MRDLRRVLATRRDDDADRVLFADLRGFTARFDGADPAEASELGLDYGEAFVGNIGRRALYDFTAVGDVVNVASRLQGQALGGEIVLSERVASGPAEQRRDAHRVNAQGQERAAGRVSGERLGVVRAGSSPAAQLAFHTIGFSENASAPLPVHSSWTIEPPHQPCPTVTAPSSRAADSGSWEGR